MTRVPQLLGDTFSSIVSWRWNRAHMRFEATHGDHLLRVRFHKVGGRWSKTFADGTPNVHQRRRGYWTAEVDGDHPHSEAWQFETSDQAKDAAVKIFRQRYGKVES